MEECKIVRSAKVESLAQRLPCDVADTYRTITSFNPGSMRHARLFVQPPPPGEVRLEKGTANGQFARKKTDDVT